jgi:hypothetical protein
MSQTLHPGVAVFLNLRLLGLDGPWRRSGDLGVSCRRLCRLKQEKGLSPLPSLMFRPVVLTRLTLDPDPVTQS